MSAGDHQAAGQNHGVPCPGVRQAHRAHQDGGLLPRHSPVRRAPAGVLARGAAEGRPARRPGQVGRVLRLPGQVHRPQAARSFFCCGSTGAACFEHHDVGRPCGSSEPSVEGLSLMEEPCVCPGCLGLYDKGEGCDHVICSKCDKEGFCSQCSAPRAAIMSHSTRTTAQTASTTARRPSSTGPKSARGVGGVGSPAPDRQRASISF